MYLKSIEMQGFKSFANKTILQFHDGITGVVGPNGSGKSNVGDAVRWVLGEQSAKQLRGGNMQDVIFSGTETRKPLGYASVAITLDNSDHKLNVDFEEVTVTRRLYRSGESEYLMNGASCRLKDINELFYDTGIGKEGYSIIGQGQIDKILSGKPEDRRELFDEAAGIVKFKRRKAAAKKKLESEQANMVRLSDIMSAPTRKVRNAIKRAAERGVRVEIMIPGKSDISFTPDAGFYIANKLRKAGAHIYVFNGGFHHSKIMMVDERFCTVGSTNLNSRSLHYDYEINAFILDLPTTAELGEVFQNDKLNSTIMTREEYKKRSVWRRFVGWFAHLFTPVI